MHIFTLSTFENTIRTAECHGELTTKPSYLQRVVVCKLNTMQKGFVQLINTSVSVNYDVRVL